MASSFRPLSVIFIIIAAVFLVNTVNSIPTGEFDSMLDTLRVRGYNLFCNAIVTSDLQLDLLFSQKDTVNRRSYTFFAPMDSSLFALDMTQTASSYTDTLRSHVVPRRLSISDLIRHPAGILLPTLLPQSYLNVTRSPDLGSVTVNGVDIAFPGLFYSRDIAVHGLAGIISLHANTATGVGSDSPVPAVAPFRSFDRRSFPPRTGPGSSGNYPVMAPGFNPVVSPIQMFNSFNVTSRAGSPPMDNTSPVNRNAYAPAREPAAADRDFHAASPYHAPKDSGSPAGLPVIHGISPATLTESPTSIFVLPPVVSHAFSPTSESPEYRRSSISTPPLEYSDMTVPAGLSPGVWLPKKHGVTTTETFTGGSEGLIETHCPSNEVPEMAPPLMDPREKILDMKDVPDKSEPLDGIDNCVNPDTAGIAALSPSEHAMPPCCIGFADTEATSNQQLL